MDYSGLLGQVAPTTMQQANEQALQQSGQQQNQQIHQQMFPVQMQTAQLQNQAAQQDMENKKLDMGISFLSPILKEPDPAKQQALMKTLVPMFNRYVPNVQLDPDTTDATTIRALVQSRISPEQQAIMQQQRAMAMGGMGMGGNSTDIFPNSGSNMSALLAPPSAPTSVQTPQSPSLATPQADQATNNVATSQGDGSAPDPLTLQSPTPRVNTEYLNSVKASFPVVGRMAEEMINGTFTPESGKGQNDPMYVMALNIAQTADPTLNAQSMLGRQSMVKNAASGDMYKQSVNLNAAAQHLYDVHEMAPLGGNPGDTPQWGNYIGRHIVTGLGEPGAQGIARLQGTVSTAAPEVAKYLGGGAATNESTANANSVLDIDNPTPTLQQNARDLFAKMMAKGGSLQDEYNKTMGGAASQKLVDPLTTAMYLDMQGKPLSAQQQALVNAHRAESNLPPKTWAPANAKQQAQGMLKPPPGTPVVSSPNDPTFQSLPPGAKFVTSDGRIMVKH